MSKNNGTQTSTFGSSKRENHDSSLFYSSPMFSELPREQKVDYLENEIDQKHLNSIICSSSENMAELPESSIHLMVTSPPYNASKDYDDDITLTEYLELLHNVFQEVYRVLVPGGRAAINIANLGRKPYIPLSSHITDIMLRIGYLMRGTIIWNKAASSGSSTAWGSWKSASNPTLRDVHEYILIFSKMNFGRESMGRKATVEKDEFLEYTKSIWEFPTVSAKKIGHPAPFPKELPNRLIKLYTFEDDVILDPFMGSGTTALAALENGRNYVGYDLEKKYVKLAEKRIKEFHTRQMDLL